MVYHETQPHNILCYWVRPSDRLQLVIAFYCQQRYSRLYSYNKCGTCRKAIRFLEDKKVKFDLFDITETPPTKQILKAAMKAKGMKKLFNTSGVQYRELNIKDKLPTMTESEAIDLLASNGRLVKRPIAVDKDKITIGFDIEEYKKVW